MGTIGTVAAAMQAVLTTAADEAAVASGFRRRRSKLGGAAFVQALVFGGLAAPDTALEDYAQAAATARVPVHPQAIDQRFGPPAVDGPRRVLAAAVRQVVAADPVAVPLRRRFPAVRVQDGTTVALPDALAAAWPGCGNRDGVGARAAVKFRVALDLVSGRSTGPFPTAGKAADQASALQAGDDLPAGALRIGDLGDFDLGTVAALGRRGVYGLSRWQEGPAPFDAAGRRWALAAWLARQAGPVVDVAVALGVAERLAARLVAFRVPPAVAQRRRRRVRAKARRKGRRPSAARLALCARSVFVTNLPGAGATAAAVSVLARARWQIELLFELWKSDGRIDASRGRKPYRVACEVFAKMVGVVVQHWRLLAGCWQRPDRSLRKASKAVRRSVGALAGALGDAGALAAAIAVVVATLAAAARVNRRRAKPATHQTLKHPTIYDGP